MIPANASDEDADGQTSVAAAHGEPARAPIPAQSERTVCTKSGQDRADAREAERLLRLLAEPGAFAALDTLDEAGQLNVFHRRKGVSLRVGGALVRASQRLERDDLARWTNGAGSGRKYLVLSEAGQARARRHAAPAAAESFQAQHADLEMQGAGEGAVLVDRAESPLAWLARRVDAHGKAFVSPAQLEAGERLRRDLEFACILPKVTASWNLAGAAGGGGGVRQHVTDVMVAARQRVDRAAAAVGPEYVGVLIDVCGFLKGLQTIETERGWPPRSGKVALAMALSALARHYGIGEAAVGPATAPSLRHWGAEGYRPTIS